MGLEVGPCIVVCYLLLPVTHWCYEFGVFVDNFMAICRIRLSDIVSLPALLKVIMLLICLKRMAMGVLNVFSFAILISFSLSILDLIWPYQSRMCDIRSRFESS